MANVRVYVAFGDDWDVESPTYTRLDVDYPIERVWVERGRDGETDTHDAGRAGFRLRDHTGDFNPLHATGAFYLNCVPRKPAKIELVNPVTDVVSTIFTGFTARWRWEPSQTEAWDYVDVELVDGLAILAEVELVADVALFGDDVVDGNIVYAEDSLLDAVRTRIVKVLDNAGWPGTTETDTLRQINSGNVGLWAKPYAPRTSALTVIKEAAEADFPAVSGGFYMSRDGKATFFGRYTRLDTGNPDYGIQTWKLGDDIAAQGAPTQIAPVAPPLTFYVDDALIFNDGFCTNLETDPGDFDTQTHRDATSIGEYGRKPWSAEGLLTRNGEGPTTADAECLLFAEYMVENYKTPHVRVEALNVIGRMPGSLHAGRTWAVICGVELNDIIQLTHSMTWGTGFIAHEFFVERIGYEIVPLNDEIDLVRLTLDVSPEDFVISNPFAGPPT